MVSDIVQGLSDFFSGLGTTFLDFIVTLIAGIFGIIIMPIDALISSVFPNFSESVQIYANGIVRLANAPIVYFSYHIPPLTKGVILLYLSIMLGYYSIIWVYRSIILIPVVINKIKFW